MQDDKNMSLDDLIKRDKMKKKAAGQGAKSKMGGIRGKMQKMAGNKTGNANGRFGGAKDFRA